MFLSDVYQDKWCCPVGGYFTSFFTISRPSAALWFYMVNIVSFFVVCALCSWYYYSAYQHTCIPCEHECIISVLLTECVVLSQSLSHFCESSSSSSSSRAGLTMDCSCFRSLPPSFMVLVHLQAVCTERSFSMVHVHVCLSHSEGHFQWFVIPRMTACRALA